MRCDVTRYPHLDTFFFQQCETRLRNYTGAERFALESRISFRQRRAAGRWSTGRSPSSTRTIMFSGVTESFPRKLQLFRVLMWWLSFAEFVVPVNRIPSPLIRSCFHAPRSQCIDMNAMNTEIPCPNQKNTGMTGPFSELPLEHIQYE